MHIYLSIAGVAVNMFLLLGLGWLIGWRFWWSVSAPNWRSTFS